VEEIREEINHLKQAVQILADCVENTEKQGEVQVEVVIANTKQIAKLYQNLKSKLKEIGKFDLSSHKTYSTNF